MANNKVQLADGTVLMDTTGVTVTQDTLLAGYTALDRSGATITGTVATAPASSTTPAMDGTADAGSEDSYARGDHVHPTDTSRQAALVSGTNIKTINSESILGSGNISIEGVRDVLFIAEYGVTPYADITAALDANKLLFCYVSWNDIVCPYIGVVNSQYAFCNLGAGESTVALYVNSSNQWSYATTNLAAQSAVDAKQAKITASGILKGDGSGGVSAATAGTDYVATETDPTVPSWAKAASKPTYTASEVGAAEASHDHAAGDITSGTLAVGRGGTGQTSAVNAANAFANALTTGSSAPVDADYYIAQYAGGGTSTTTYHRRPHSALWTYIKGKADALYAAISHDHAAGDITSGTLPVNRGGTGAASFTANRAIISGSTTTGAFTTRAITNNTAATSAITGSTNLLTMNTLRYALNRTTGPGTADTNYGTSMMRPIQASTTDLTAGSSSLTSGAIYLVYEA